MRLRYDIVIGRAFVFLLVYHYFRTDGEDRVTTLIEAFSFLYLITPMLDSLCTIIGDAIKDWCDKKDLEDAQKED
jgi:hypothetical protein